MNTLSIGGLPSTIRSYKHLCELIFGHEHPSVKYLDKMASESPNGLDEEILADESQMVYMLCTMKE
jgi:hypothetical protein